MTKYFLHVGLHKTATKYFQHKVFPNLPTEDYIYNPSKLTQLLADLMKADACDLPVVYDAIKHEKLVLDKDKKKVVISREIMSGDLFTLYKNYEEKQDRLFNAIPDARIILFLRFQTDWLLSCYRETVHEHHFQSIEEFLLIKEGCNKFIHTKYSDLDLIGIVGGYIKRFGRENMHFFFYEDFVRDKSAIVEKIADTIELADKKYLRLNTKVREIPNRGYSALSIMISIYRYKILKVLGLSDYLIHRPIIFFGESSIPAGFEELSVLPADKYWGSAFYRDNEEVRSPGYPNELTLGEKLRMLISWRSIIKKGIDRLFYFDWDLASSIRPELNKYYWAENKKLAMMLGINEDLIPSRYVKELKEK